jgi:predicted nucleic acid-binding protein
MKLRLLRSLETTGPGGGRPLAVVDACVQVSALVARDGRSSNVRVVEAAAGGLYVCVLSQPLKLEVIEAFSRPKLGSRTPHLVEAHMAPLWERAEMVDMAEPDPVFSRAVSDLDDDIVLRTAAGVMFEPRLATISPRYIVTNNVGDFRGRNFYGFRIVTAAQFWRELSEGVDAGAEADTEAEAEVG